MNKDEISLLVKEMLDANTQEHIQHLKDHEDKGVKWGLIMFFIFVVQQMYLVYLIWNK
jgi:hypothetical protein